MLRSVRLGNFKSFSRSQNANLRPITLIYGPNSSGKSSIIQSLLLIKQSSGAYSAEEPLNFDGPDFTFGNVRSVIHRQRPRKMRLGVGFDLTSEHKGELGRLSRSVDDVPIGDLLASFSDDSVFALDWDFDVSPDGTVPSHRLAQVTYSVFDPSDYFEWEHSFRGGNLRDISNNEYGVVDYEAGREFRSTSRSSFYSLIERSVHRSGLDKDFADEILRHFEERLRGFTAEEDLRRLGIVRFEQRERAAYSRKSPGNGRISLVRRPPEQDASILRYHQYCAEIIQILNLMKFAKDNAFQRLVHIGPVRAVPEQGLYTSRGARPRNVGSSGENMIEILSRDAKGNRARQLSYWLHQLGINYSVEVKPLGDQVTGGVAIYQLVLRDTANGRVEVTPQNVGVGVPQVMPIVTQGISASDQIICVEQPELHLHPRLQANLADFILENCKNNGNQWIVETHSELLMRRLSRRIREGTLNHEEVSVLYVQPDRRSGSSIMELRLNGRGDFVDPWPEGFFEEGYNELGIAETEIFT